MAPSVAGVTIVALGWAISRDCPELQALGGEVVVEGNVGAVCTVQVEGAEGEGSLESDHGGESS